MKSEDNSDNSRNGNKNTDKNGNDIYTNTVEVGSVGIEGGSDNGASTLRVMKKKHANGVVSSKKPIKHHL